MYAYACSSNPLQLSAGAEMRLVLYSEGRLARMAAPEPAAGRSKPPAMRQEVLVQPAVAVEAVAEFPMVSTSRMVVTVAALCAV